MSVFHVALLGLLLAATAADAETFKTKAPFALLVDISDGKVLFQKNADSGMIPASTSKILTAEIVFSRLASGKLSLDDSFAVSSRAAAVGAATAGGSSMLAEAGERIKVEELLQGLLTDSGNDAANTLAEGIAGSEKGFAAIMNAEARRIGMRRSHFGTPSGLSGNRTTPRDMVRLASYVIETYPQYYKYFGQPEFTWRGVRQENRNPLLAEGADGLKTGHLDASGFGLVGSAPVGGHRLVLVLNGLKSEKERASEGRRLLEYGRAALGG